MTDKDGGKAKVDDPKTVKGVLPGGGVAEFVTPPIDGGGYATNLPVQVIVPAGMGGNVQLRVAFVGTVPALKLTVSDPVVVLGTPVPAPFPANPPHIVLTATVGTLPPRPATVEGHPAGTPGSTPVNGAILLLMTTDNPPRVIATRNLMAAG